MNMAVFEMTFTVEEAESLMRAMKYFDLVSNGDEVDLDRPAGQAGPLRPWLKGPLRG
jgi:hypothetical protein